MNYRDAFDRTVRCHGSEIALINDKGYSLTYSQLDERATRLANALREQIGKQPCSFLGVNSLEAIEAMLAGHKRAGPTVQLPFRSKPRELIRKHDTVDSSALIVGSSHSDTAEKMINKTDFEEIIQVKGEDTIDLPDAECYEKVLANSDNTRLPQCSNDDLVSIFYTSGTTTQPKAVPFNGEQLWYGAIQGVMEHGLSKNDVGVMATPWYHMVSSATWLYPHMLAGSTVVPQANFNPVKSIELIENNKATGLLAVPTQLNDILQEVNGKDCNVESLSYVRTGGSVVSDDLIEETSEQLASEIYNTYGMTEAGPNIAFADPNDQLERPGTIGKEAYSYELRVVEPKPVTETPDPDATIDVGEKGEVIARGPGQADGYISNPKAEEKTFFRGWLRTRDIARVDKDGFLYIVDRIDNMFQSGGENIYPAEVEAALENHKNIQETFVYGKDHERWGKVVCAVVVGSAEISEDEIDKFCRECTNLANYKRPREYEIRSVSESLPRTTTGKIKRNEIIDGI